MAHRAAVDRRPAAIIDLVSSDDEDTPPLRIRRGGNFSRELRSPSLFPPPDNAPAPAPVPAPATGGSAAGGAQVIDLEDINFEELFEIPFGYPENQAPAAPPRDPTPPQTGQFINIDGEDVFIPDSPRPARQNSTYAQRQHQEAIEQQAAYDRDTQNFTSDVCLSRVLAIFPDIDHEHVTKLYKDYDAQGVEALPGAARFEAIVEKLTSGGSYPKQVKQPRRKRKRDDDGTAQEKERWEGPNRETAPPALRGAMASILKADFPDITKQAISDQLNTSKHLFQAYIALAKMKDSSDANKKWTGRAAPRGYASAATVAINCGWPTMTEELEAARKHVKELRHQRVIEEAKNRAEQENLQRAIDANETAECNACFEDLPMNRQIHCNGDTAHFTCFDCATTYIKSEVGDSRCRVLCTAGCGAPFAHAQLHLLEDKELLAKLEQLQQEKEIREADLDDLEECPFCDYKAILPPIEEDFEFRCLNDECEKVSCRRCKALSHIPLSCEEHAKENKISSRHKIEEAMTAAMIRSCAKCNKQFIKEYGCNKMTCPSCGNLQCYVCSETLKDYNHFEQMPNGQPGPKGSKCPLYDNVEERHEREVKEAEAAARAEVINDNPDVTEKDLEIKVSDAVKKATDDRLKRAGAVPGGIPPGFGGPRAAEAGFMYRGPGALGLIARARGRRLGAGDDDLEAEPAGEDGNAALHRYHRNLVGLEQAREDVRRRRERLADIARIQRELRGELMNAAGPAQAMPEPPAVHPGRLLGPVMGAPRPAVMGPAPVPRAPAAQIPLPELPGGFNEDPFGAGDDGDPFALPRLLNMPARAVRAGQPAYFNPYAVAAAQPPEDRQRERLAELELQRRQLQAFQNFNDRRGGQGRAFVREPEDPRRRHVPGGWPDQN